MTRRRSFALGAPVAWIAFVALVVIVQSGAASPCRADAAAEARFHDERARTRFEARDFGGAIEDFLTANRIAPNARLLYNAALCFEQLRDAENAFAYFAEYLASDDSLEGAADRRAVAERTMETLRSEVARVHVVSEPPGATIFVDTEDHGSYGVTPRTIAVPPGRHRVVVVLEGYARRVAEVEVPRGAEVRVDERLVRLVGTLRIDAIEPIPVVIRSADGRIASEGSVPGEFALPPGAYTITGGDAVNELVASVATVRAETTTVVRVRAVPVPVPTGETTITANTSGALVSLDGVEVGFTPSIVRDVPVGVHRLRVDEPGHDPWEGEIEIRASERTWVTTNLRSAGRRRRSPIGIAIGAVGLSGLLSFAVTAPMALRSHRTFEQSDPLEAAAARERGQNLNRASDILLGFGTVVAATGLTLVFTLDDPHDTPSSATVSAGPP